MESYGYQNYDSSQRESGVRSSLLTIVGVVFVILGFLLGLVLGNAFDEDDFTTTTAYPTTTAPMTTTTAPWIDWYDPSDFDVIVPDTVGYTGKALNVVDIMKPAGVKTATTYQKLDAYGWVIEERGNEKPVDCGLYQVTVTFSWTRNDKTDPLPSPISRVFSVVPGSLAAMHDEFGAKDSETLFKTTNMRYDPLNDDNLIVGSVPYGIVRSASIVKLSSKYDYGAGTPTYVAGKITSADGAGYYRVTITYAEENGKDNFWDEATLSDTAIVYVRPIEKTANKVASNAITLDGEIDALYGAPVFETMYQAHTTKTDSMGNAVFDKIDMTQLVNPYQYAAALQISRGANITDAMVQNAATAKFYAVWDGVYVYIAIEVTDSTNYARTAAYTSKPNPWINDSVELYYHFGGDNVPDMSAVRETYPTYKGIVRDSATGEGGFTALGAQKSHYFAPNPADYTQPYVQCAVQGRGIGDNTYVIEYKLPAKTETYTGTPGATGDQAFKTYAGENLVAGDFIYLAYQIDDLMGLPYKRLNSYGEYDALGGYLSNERWESMEEYDALIGGFWENKYKDMEFGTSPEKDSPWYNFEFDAASYTYLAGNRSASSYLKVDGCAPMILALGN